VKVGVNVTSYNIADWERLTAMDFDRPPATPDILAFTASVPDFALSENLHDFEVHAFADDPNELYMEFKSDMTLKSGREYKNDYLARMTVKDGKVFRFVEYPEPIRLLYSLGGSINPPTDHPNIEHGN